MNLLRKIKISYYTYFFLLVCLFSGFIKNILIIYFICIFHELGHILFINIFHYKIISINILPFGGYTIIDKKINTSINKDIIISIGGIIFQIILFILLYFFKDKINIIDYNLLINYNLILLFFNLLPIIPLDGSNIFNLLLEKILPSFMSYKINIFLSLIILVLFLFFNISYQIDNYFIISFLTFKIIERWKNFKYYRQRFILERYLYQNNYKKIDNKIKNIEGLKKEVYHFFKCGKKYTNEKEFIKNKFFYN